MKLLLPLLLAILTPLFVVWAYPTWKNKLAAITRLREFIKVIIVSSGLILAVITTFNSENFELYFGIAIGLIVIVVVIFDTLIFKKTKVEKEYDALLAIEAKAYSENLKEDFKKSKLGKMQVSTPVAVIAIVVLTAMVIFGVFHSF